MCWRVSTKNKKRRTTFIRAGALPVLPPRHAASSSFARRAGLDAAPQSLRPLLVAMDPRARLAWVLSLATHPSAFPWRPCLCLWRLSLVYGPCVWSWPRRWRLPSWPDSPSCCRVPSSPCLLLLPRSPCATITSPSGRAGWSCLLLSPASVGRACPFTCTLSAAAKQPSSRCPTYSFDKQLPETYHASQSLSGLRTRVWHVFHARCRWTDRLMRHLLELSFRPVYLAAMLKTWCEFVVKAELTCCSLLLCFTWCRLCPCQALWCGRSTFLVWVPVCLDCSLKGHLPQCTRLRHSALGLRLLFRGHLPQCDTSQALDVGTATP